MTTKSPHCVQTVLAVSIQVWALSAVVLMVRAQDRADPAVDKQAQSDERARQERKKELEEMRRRAQSTTVWQVRGADKMPAGLVPEPVLRFDSQYHRCVDATVWLYGTKGRPAAALEVECYDRPGAPKYFYCLVSLSDGLIEAQWPGGRVETGTHLVYGRE